VTLARLVLMSKLFTGGLVLAQITPVPLVNQPVVPASTAPGGPNFNLTVNGTGFVPGAVVNWSGHARNTIFVSPSRLRAAIPSTLISSAGTASITVQNPGGPISNAVAFQVINSSTSAGVLSGSAYAAGSSVARVAVADFNGDGKLDLAATDTILSEVLILLGNGDGTFPAALHHAAGVAAFGIVVGDFNGDRKMDVAVTNSDPENSISVLLGDGDGTLQDALTFAVDIDPVSVAAADLNRDGTLDLAVANHGSPSVSVLLGNGDGTFQPHAEYAVSASPSSVAVGDFDGDSWLDLAVSAQGRNAVSILLSNADGTFKPKVDYPTGVAPVSVAAADFSSDGALDLAVVNSGGASISFLQGNGNGTFRRRVVYATLQNPRAIALGDFNGDAALDLAVADDNDISMLLGAGDGTFASRKDQLLSRYTGIAAGDFNGDGRQDLAGVGLGRPVHVLLQSSVTLSNTSIDFGQQSVGTVSTPKTVLLTNIGTAELNIQGIAITGANPTDFRQRNDCGSSVAPGAFCRITAVFAPGEVGVRDAKVEISDDAVGGVQTIRLTGTGI
jgi:hypothetical protein